ncbi:MAG TPA: phosphoribosylaminoimidazolecarboxamide formyltransferase [Polyangiaceae bacterium]|jgi:phosphoribosylaminoimidazolecarboxamide formyltransferase/IMP cyclohydrolase|nr:phosphoribosylaminoimidazolecarboxamide formyltransferase [Polyangiaceae bacterium]
MQLKYGTNPHQRHAAVDPVTPGTQPIEVLNGTPSLINFLDALNAWQLVRELRGTLGLPAATSFKHVSPAGAAVAVPLPDDLRKVYEVEGRELSPAALAYVRARGADPKSSFGDFVALSDRVDRETAEFLKAVVSDGIVAPGYDPAALEILKAKKGGSFIVMRADPDYEPPPRESRELFGVRLTQDRNDHVIGHADLANVKIGALTDDATRDLLLGLVTLKYTQSNSVGYAWGGQMIGIGAGQQSRVDCTKLAGAKADVWQLGRHPKVLGLRFNDAVKRQERINHRVRYIEGDLTREEIAVFRDALSAPAEPLTEAEKAAYLGGVTGVSLVSDGFIPFRDNIDHARKHGVSFIAEPGGSARDSDIEGACREYGMALVYTNLRLFHH